MGLIDTDGLKRLIFSATITMSNINIISHFCYILLVVSFNLSACLPAGRKRTMAKCSICKKTAVVGSNVSHSQVHAKRKFKPNLQKVNGVVLCTRCLRTMDKAEKASSKNK